MLSVAVLIISVCCNVLRLLVQFIHTSSDKRAGHTPYAWLWCFGVLKAQNETTVNPMFAQQILHPLQSACQLY